MKQKKSKARKFCSLCRGLLIEDREKKDGIHTHCVNDIYECDEDQDMDEATQSHGQD